MQVQLETLSSLERRMSIALPLLAVDALVNERLKRTARRAKIQGFRPGKAPLKIVAANYGAQIREEVLGDQIQQRFYDAITEHKLRVAGYPRFEAVEQHDVENFLFRAVFEVYPEVKVGNLSEIEIEEPETAVTAVEVDKTIDTLRKQRVNYVAVRREAGAGDRVTIDFKGTIGGVAFDGGTAANVTFVLGQQQMLAEFETGVIGLKPEESRNIDVIFPQDYHGKHVAGKQAVFEILLKNVEEAQLPLVDARFAQNLGVLDGDMEKLRTEIEENVQREVKHRLFLRTKEQVVTALLAATNIELPNALVQLEMERLTEQMQRSLQNRRGSHAKHAEKMQFPVAVLRQRAQRAVAWGLILAALVEAHKLVASKEQVHARIEEMAVSYEDPQEVIQWYHASPDRLEEVARWVLEEQVIEFVLSQAKVVRKVLPFDSLMDNTA